VCRRVDQAGASYLTEAASNSVTHAAHDSRHGRVEKRVEAGGGGVCRLRLPMQLINDEMLAAILWNSRVGDAFFSKKKNEGKHG
jgi:two-component sensor histidine kinase